MYATGAGVKLDLRYEYFLRSRIIRFISVHNLSQAEKWRKIFVDLLQDEDSVDAIARRCALAKLASHALLCTCNLKNSFLLGAVVGFQFVKTLFDIHSYKRWLCR
jgi:hypothetical protein